MEPKQNGPNKCCQHLPGLTRSLDSTKEGLMPNHTHIVGPAANPRPGKLPKTPLVIPQRVAARAATRFTRDEAGCYVSTYSVGSHGYAQIGWSEHGGTRTVTAHRAAWVHAHGTQIPEGMTIDHLCKNSRCVNPNHLRLLSNYENARRTFGRDWPVGECANGHPNSRLVQNSRGRWECVDCRKIWASHRKPKTPTPEKPAAQRQSTLQAQQSHSKETHHEHP